MAAGEANTPALAAVLCGLIYLAVLGRQLAVHQYDPSAFIKIGETYVTQAAHVPRNVQVIPDALGYDGQFYYQIALNPLSPHWNNYGLGLDNGPYRHQRILYPLLVWLLSLGNHDVIPGMMLLLNYVALCALAWIGARFVQMHGLHAAWGTLFAIYPGFLFSLTYDLTEILSSVCLLAALWTLERNSAPLLTGILLSLAVLARETTLLAALALGLATAIDRRTARWPALALPLGVYCLWQFYLWAKWDALPLQTAGLLFGTPGIGFRNLVGSLAWTDELKQVWLIEIAYLAGLGITAVAAAARAAQPRLKYWIMWILSCAMLVLMSEKIWITDVAFMRAATEYFLFSLILVITSLGHGHIIAAGAGTAAIWILVCAWGLQWW